MKKHLKRLPAPRTWTIARKEAVWATKPRPGPHATGKSLPIVSLIRGSLSLADNAREAERILFSRSVLVDGRVVTDPKFPVGLMDVVTLVPSKAHYRILLDDRGRIVPMPIEAAESSWKLCRIEGKGTIKGGATQIRLHDGRTLLPGKTDHATGTTLKLAVPAQKVLGALPLAPGHIAILTGGAHAGEIVHVERIEKTRNPRANVVHFTEGFSTINDYVFVIGTESPEIRVPEGRAV